MTEHHFDTPRPVRLFTEVSRGSVTITANDTAESHIDITGRDAEHVVVRQDGEHLTVVAPKQRGGLFGSENRLDITISLPTRSQLNVRTGSADITVSGTVAGTQLKSGSGDVVVSHVDGPLVVETGSGDIRIEFAGAELKAKSGSGDVVVEEVSATSLISTGSGDVQLGTTQGPAVIKTGSGDVKVGDAGTDVTMTTGSGDFVVTTVRRGRMTAKGASGDVHVGVPAGVPVWTDISTVSGEIRSSLEGAGQPADGVDHIELRAKTVSGDVILTQV